MFDNENEIEMMNNAAARLSVLEKKILLLENIINNVDDENTWYDDNTMQEIVPTEKIRNILNCTCNSDHHYTHEEGCKVLAPPPV